MNQNGIEFNNVPSVGMTVITSPIGAPNGRKIINAVDIDWNGANVSDTSINTTGELLNWIESKSNGIDESTLNEYAKKSWVNEQLSGIQGGSGTVGPKGDTGPKGDKGDTGTFDDSTLNDYATLKYVDNQIIDIKGDVSKDYDSLKKIEDIIKNINTGETGQGTPTGGGGDVTPILLRKSAVPVLQISPAYFIYDEKFEGLDEHDNAIVSIDTKNQKAYVKYNKLPISIKNVEGEDQISCNIGKTSYEYDTINGKTDPMTIVISLDYIYGPKDEEDVLNNVDITSGVINFTITAPILDTNNDPILDENDNPMYEDIQGSISIYINRLGSFKRNVVTDIYGVQGRFEEAFGSMTQVYPLNGDDPTGPQGIQNWYYRQINSAQSSITTLQHDLNEGNQSLRHDITELQITASGIQARVDSVVDDAVAGAQSQFQSLIEQTASEISSTVMEQVEEGIDEKITSGVQSTISQHADSITATVTEQVMGDVQELITGVQSQITGVQSQIEQTASEITATVQGQQDDIDELSGTVSSHTTNIATLTQNYNSISGTVSSHTTDINKLTGDIESISDDVSELQITASEISTTVTHHGEDINALNGTVEDLSTDVSNISQTASNIRTEVNKSISGVQGSINGIQSQIEQTASEITATVRGQQEDINELSGTVSSHTTSISTLAQNYNSISGTVSSHTTDINKLTGDVENISDDVSKLQITASEISTTVAHHGENIDELSGTVNDLSSNISQTAGEIRSEVNNKIEGVQSRITQTANNINATISNKIGDVQSQINQTASSIRLDVKNSGIDIDNQRIILDANTVQVKSGSSKQTLFTNGKIKTDFIDANAITTKEITVSNTQGDAQGGITSNKSNIGGVGVTNNEDVVMWAGRQGNDIHNSKFYVKSSGLLHAENADIVGSIKATSFNVMNGSSRTSIKFTTVNDALMSYTGIAESGLSNGDPIGIIYDTDGTTPKYFFDFAPVNPGIFESIPELTYKITKGASDTINITTSNVYKVTKSTNTNQVGKYVTKPSSSAPLANITEEIYKLYAVKYLVTEHGDIVNCNIWKRIKFENGKRYVYETVSGNDKYQEGYISESISGASNSGSNINSYNIAYRSKPQTTFTNNASRYLISGNNKITSTAIDLAKGDAVVAVQCTPRNAIGPQSVSINDFNVFMPLPDPPYYDNVNF